VLVSFVDPEDATVEHGLPPGLVRVHRLVKRPWTPHDPLALLPRTVRGGFCDPALRTAVAAQLAAERFDIAQYEYVEMANLMAPSTVPAVLTVHQLGFAQEGPRWCAAGRDPRRAPAAFFRYCRDLDWELRAVQQARQVVTISVEDARRLLRYLPDLRVTVSPLGVDCDSFHPPATAVPIESDVLFVGHFLHPPNVDAARFLIEEIVPRIGRPVRVRIVGRAIPSTVTALARAGAVEVGGPVPDVRPVLASAAVVVAPVRFGTGMRGKVLEALAMGRPVVTTSLGAEGLGATAGQHLLVADDAPRFAAAVRRALDDQELARALGAAGRRLVETCFDWNAIAAAHDQIYEAALAVPPAPPPPPLERAALLHRTLGRAGWAPALATGAALVSLSALRWHLTARSLSTPPTDRSSTYAPSAP
jgi:glycosyltransferase involved in cell wall biosynthesis